LFAIIANRLDFDAAKLALFLLEPHPKMPKWECLDQKLRTLRRILQRSNRSDHDGLFSARRDAIAQLNRRGNLVQMFNSFAGALHVD
jgi:hypothetical protein